MLKSLIAEMAQILAFKPKAHVPTLALSGTKYVLSNYWPALTSLAGAELGGAKLVSGGDPDKFRYLWAYDTEKKYVQMWRVSDGDEKVAGTDRQLASELAALGKLGQLNRVTTAEMKALELAMGKKNDDTLSSLRASIEANKDELERELDVKLKDRVGRVVQAPYFKGLADARQGVTPIGFKSMYGSAAPGDPFWVRQVASHVLSTLWQKEMSEKVVEAWLRKQKFPVDQLGNQDLSFALNDLYYDRAEEWLPKRT